MTFTSPFNHWHYGSHGKVPTPTEPIQGSLFPRIDCLGFNTCHLRWLVYWQVVIVHTDFSPFQTKLASISVGLQALCMRPNCPGLRPDVHHPTTLLLAWSPSLIDFPLLCHCGVLFKHTFCDVRSHTVWHPNATVSSTNMSKAKERLQ